MQETYQNILFMQPWGTSANLSAAWHQNISTSQALNARTLVHNGKWEQQKRCMLSDIAMKHLFEVFKHLWFPCHRKENNTSYNCGGKQWYLSRDAGLTRPSAPKKRRKIFCSIVEPLGMHCCQALLAHALWRGPGCRPLAMKSVGQHFFDVQVLWLWFYTFLACL